MCVLLRGSQGIFLLVLVCWVPAMFARRKDCSAIKIPCPFSFSLLALLCEELIVSVWEIQLRFNTESFRGGLYNPT